MMKHRDSNIELLRIMAMLMVLLLHANYFSFGPPKVEDVLSSPFVSFGRVLAEQLCIVGVNVFVLISGWFGIKPSLKGLSNLLYQVLFWAIIIVLLGWTLGYSLSIKSLAKLFWFGSSYWFVEAYIGLYILSPILNTFVETTTRKTFLLVLIGFFSAEFIYGWIGGSASYGDGYSMIAFVGLYLLARYIRLYANKYNTVKSFHHFSFFFLFSLIPALISFLGYRNGWPQLRPLSYISPFVIFASMSLLLFFWTLRIESKIINWIAGSVFSVYLIHLHPLIIPLFKSTVVSLSATFSSISFMFIVVLFSIVLLLICVILDQLRVQSWRLFLPLARKLKSTLLALVRRVAEKQLIRF